MTDNEFRNSYAILDVSPDADLFRIKAAYNHRLAQLQRKLTKPSEYALLRDDYHRLIDPVRRAKLDQKLARLRARQGHAKAKPAPKEPYASSDPVEQYKRMMATAKGTRTRARYRDAEQYNEALNEAEHAYHTGRIGSTERDGRIDLAESDLEAKIDQINAKFDASEAKATELFGRPGDLPESEGQEATA